MTKDEQERLSHACADVQALSAVVAALIQTHPDKAALREAMTLFGRASIDDVLYSDIHASRVKAKLDAYFLLV